MRTKKKMPFFFKLKSLKNNKNNKKYKVGTDCSGIEAPVQALKLLNVNYDHIFSSDINKYCIKFIKQNHNPKYIYDDITNRKHKNIPDIDIYVAGFPCQAFSSQSAGKRKGFDDTRGTIFFHCLETIKHSKPNIFILENVKGLVNHDNGNTFKIILDKLNKLKIYNIYYKILNTKNFGIPQNRPRIYIIGIKKSRQKKKFIFPEPKLYKYNMNDYLSDNNDNKYRRITPHMKNIIKRSKVNEKENWLINVNSSLPEFSTKMKDLSPCLLAGNSAFYITSKKRKITEREALMLQGFPNNLNFNDIPQSQIYKFAGNSMSVNVIAHLFRNIFDSMY